MVKPLRLYTDGSLNPETLVAGWAYLLVHGGCVLLAESGTCHGDSNHSEYMAIIQGLLAVPPTTRVHVITDRNDVGDMVQHPHRQKCRSGRLASYRRAICKMIHPRHVKVKVIESGGSHWSRRADDLARHACGLVTKNQKKRISKKRNKKSVDN
jgi:ribonuclease HI